MHVLTPHMLILYEPPTSHHENHLVLEVQTTDNYLRRTTPRQA